ncbi:MAG: MBL fold metallo-hydrolase, partial [Pyrinomonadaceae bacterium]|nr:MBL fold metallo-hydrolase [Pyrinomonadaceae bacterium]
MFRPTRITILRSGLSFVFLTIFLMAASLPVFTQVKQRNGTVESFRKAIELTESALREVQNGNPSGRSRRIFWKAEGRSDISARLQGLTHENPDFVEYTESFGIDPVNNAVFYEYDTKVNHDASETIRFVYDGDGQLLVANPVEKWALWAGGPDTETQKNSYQRMLPQALLEEALQNRRTLRYNGKLRLGEEQVDVATFSLRDSQAISLLFSSKDGSYRGLEYLIDHPMLGDTAVRWVFDDFRDLKGFGLLPYKYEIFLGSRLLKSMKITEVRTGFDVSGFLSSSDDLKIPDRPSEKRTEADSRKKPAIPVEKIDEGVYLVRNIRGGFHVLVVEFEESLLIVDAPAGYHELQQIPASDWAGAKKSSEVGERLLNVLKNRFPKKPVKYVALTHHHGDHAGGIHPFIKAGATIVASRETIEAVENSLKRSFRLDSSEPLPGTDFKRQYVSDKSRIKEADVVVELRNVGKNPHSEGMVVVYLPRQKLLYQSDLFEPFREDAEPSASRLPVM